LPAGGSVDFTTKQLLELGTNFKQQFSQTHQLNSTDKSAEPTGKNSRSSYYRYIIRRPRSIGTVRIWKIWFAFWVDKKAQLIAQRDPKLLAGKQLINLSKYPPVKTLLAGKSGRVYYSQVRRYGFGTGNRPEILSDDGGNY
jgi:hypothetical protein